MDGRIRTSLSPTRVSLLAALLAGCLAASPADAQSGSAAGEADAAAHEPARARLQSLATDLPANALQDSKLESVLGRELKTRDEDPGRIIDILCDRNGKVRAAVVELGGFLGIGTRKIAVEWSALRFDSPAKRPTVVLEMTRDQLRSAREYKSSDPVFKSRTAD